MKEKDDSSFSDECSINNIQISNNDIELFRKILCNREFITIHINTLIPNYIDLNMNSFLKINKFFQLNPEENIVFIYNKKILYTASNSFRLSSSSIYNIRNQNSYLSDSSKIENFKNIVEETINTDIIKTKDDNNLNKNVNYPINIQSSIEKELYQDDNNKNNTNSTFMNNMKNKQKNNKRNENNKKFLLFKWIYHFYLIIGLIILLHYISFIFSKYNYAAFYKYICFLLIVSLLYIGYRGQRIKNSNVHYLIFNENNLFWINFFIFIITIISAIGLVIVGGYFNFIKSQGIIGYLIFFVYLLALIVEAIYVIYYDIIIEEINSEKNNDGLYGRDILNIQLVDVN